MNPVMLLSNLKQYFIEDIGEEDMTSTAIFPKERKGNGVFIAKEEGIIAGIEIIEEGYRLLDRNIEVKPLVNDGDMVRKGDILAEVSGSVVAILAGERVILNALQRMSGIATLTRKSVDVLDDPQIQICDTRKTTPGFRMFEKYAVVVGGGKNHRFGLSDAVMIKDNHISFCGSITKAVKKVRKRCGHMVKIEVETETEDEVLEAVAANVDVIMFDNQTPKQVRALSKLVPTSIITEASGGITLNTISQYRHTGVDMISLGYLTHSVKALDISLQVTV